MAPFTLNEKISVTRLAGATDPVYGTPLAGAAAVVVADHIWANVQDVLPSRAESTQNGLRVGVQRARLRIRVNSAITGEMSVILHGRGDRVMQIIAGPALLDNRIYVEFMLEGYSK